MTMQMHADDAPRTGAAFDWLNGLIYAAIAALGAGLFWLSEFHLAELPVWLPWDFSVSIYAATALTLFWFLRGLRRAPAAERPSPLRILSFLAGLVLTYAVLQTRIEYWSQHMFFLNRMQHVAMHHLGPMLMALGWPGAAMAKGIPARLRRLIARRPAEIFMRIVQQPLIAAFLFVGLFYFWLIPDVHFRAMIDPQVYAVMNWTMVLDGLLFWCLVLDPRPKPPARVSFATRAALAIGVMFPQIILGAFITFAPHELYAYYELCGRLFPSIGAMNDQHIGGIVIWIPPAMMSVIAMLLVLNALRRQEDSREETDDDAASLAALAREWTGR